MSEPGRAGEKIEWPTRLIVVSLFRSLATVIVYLVAYFVLPWKSFSDWAALGIVLAFLAIALLTAVWQIGRIMRASAPAVQAIEALAIITPIYLLAFSLGYFMLSLNDPSQFSEPLSRMGALYFTISIFATVGFGDIAASVDLTRAVVAAQMVLNLIVLGIGIKVILAAVKWGRDLKKRQPSGE